MYQHIHPEEIEPRSLACIDAEVPEPRPFYGMEWAVVRRMIHTSADFSLLESVRLHPEAIQAGIHALRSGADIVTDTQMALAGISRQRLAPFGCTVRCLMGDPDIASRAKADGVTRAWAAVDAVMARGGADIFVMGNAPTALYRLLDRVEQGAPAPRLVVGMPVGFVNAAESKEILMAQKRIPFITVAGRKGGSALAASVINALAILAAEQGTCTS
ncbi:precorrin-8X methylmutase [Desulfovibrionales bacterium]